MAWRPPYNYKDCKKQEGAYSRGRGFVPPPWLGHQYTGRHEMSHQPAQCGFGRGGRYPFVIPQPSQPSLGAHQDTFHYNSTTDKDYHYPKLPQHSPERTNTDMNFELEALESTWQDNRVPDKKAKGELLYKKLASILSSQMNPWSTALNLITSASDYDEAKTVTLSFNVLLQFQKWVNGPDNIYAGREEEFLSQEFRIHVFYATTGRHIPYFGAAVEAFHLCHEGNEYFLPIAKTLLLRDKLPEAAQIVCKLCLQSHFSRDEILVPLLLTDRINLIDMYIKGDSQQQMLILGLLDHLCARNTDIIAFAQSTGLKNIKGEKLSKKSLSKFAMRLMKMFDIPPEMCPNISDNRAMSTVRFLLYKRYIEKSMNADCWDDMVESVIGSNVNLQQQFIMELMSYNDIQEAAKWANKYYLPDTVLDPSVVDARCRLRKCASQLPECTASTSSNEVKEEEDWNKELCVPRPPGQDWTTYYSIPLKDEDIILVDSRPKLMAALERLTKPSTAIGIDCEWKPIGPSKQVALLQLAVEDRVFLVDLVQLDGLVSPQDWRHFAQAMFCDDHILKIGYGLDTDLRMLSTSYPSMTEPFSKMVKVIELFKLAKKIEDRTFNTPADENKMKGNSYKKRDLQNEDSWTNGEQDDDNETDSEESNMVHGVDDKDASADKNITKCGFYNKTEEKGLSLLVKRILGKPLCKDEQMSNWEKRPLRRSQIQYAAMDAFVLLEIHKHLVTRGQAMGMSQNELEPPVIFKSRRRQDKKKHKMTSGKKKPALASSRGFPHGTHGCRPYQFRVVCDSMLQGLGNQLRACGVDACILSTGHQHEDAVQIALQENRIILTTGIPYEQIRNRVGDGMCYCVSNTIKSKDQCVDVLRHFKVDVKVDDIFSRCAVCNSADFAHIRSVDMENLYVINMQRNQQRMAYPSCHITDVDNDTKEMFSSTYGVDASSITFIHNGIPLQIETIPSLEAFQSIDVFFACVNCGKVYWKGSHFKHIQQQFRPVLDIPSHMEGHSGVNPGHVGDEGAGVGQEGYDDAVVGDYLDSEFETVSLQDAGYSGVWKIV